MHKPNLLTRLYHTVLYCVASLLILMAVIFTFTRMLTPTLNNHREAFQKIASANMHNPVSLGHIQLGWRGLEPEILLNDVTLYHQDSAQRLTPFLKIKQFYISLNLWQSLLNRHWMPGVITVSGVVLSIKQIDKATYEINDMTLRTHRDDDQPNLDFEKLKGWFLGQNEVSLDNISIDFYDEKNAGYPLLVKELNLVNDDNHHLLTGVINLRNTDAVINLILKVNGSLKHPEHLAINFYAKLKNLNLGKWLTQHVYGGYRLSRGYGETEIWLNWSHGHFTQQFANLKLYDLKLTSIIDQSVFSLTSLSGHFSWQPLKNGWQFTADQLSIINQAKIWPDISFIIQAQHPIQKPAIYYLQLSSMDLKATSEFLKGADFISEPVRKILTNFRPQGIINHLRYTTEGSLFKPARYRVLADFNDLGFDNVGNIPGITHFDVRLQADEKKGQATLRGNHSLFTLENLFNAPLLFNQLQGDIAWEKNQIGWLIKIDPFLAANSDLNIKSKATLQFSTKKDLPDINLTAQATLQDPKKVPLYLPRKGISASATTWLDQAFLGGNPVSANVILKGNLSQFPFDQKESGLFRVVTKINGIDLRYAPGWPTLNNLAGELIFADRSMTAHLTGGSTLTTKIQSGEVTIPAIKKQLPLIIKVKGIFTDQVEGLLNFIKASPLQNSIGNALDQIKLTGPATLQLNLSIPVATPENTEVAGTLHIPNSQIQLVNAGIGAESIQGDLSFTQHSLAAKKLTGVFLGQPVTATINTSGTQQSPIAHLEFSTSLNVNQLKQQFKNIDSLAIGGQGPLTGNFSFPLGSNSQQQSSLKLQSQLEGISVNYPAPLMKAATQKAFTNLTVNFGGEQPMQLFVNYANRLHAAALITHQNNQLQLYGLVLHLGNQLAYLPTEKGIVIDGQIASFDWRDWQPFLKQSFATNQSGSIKNMFKSLDLQIGELKAFNFDFQPAKINMVRGLNSWLFTLITTPIAGTITLPDNLTQAALSGRFQRLYLNPMPTQSNSLELKPNDIPAFSVEADDFRFANKALGQLNLQVSPIKTGLSIDQLKLQDPLFKANLRGRWVMLNNKAETYVSGHITSQNLQELLHAWNIQSSLIAQQSSLGLNLRWPGAPYDFSFIDTIGEMSVLLKNGWIIDLSESTTKKLNIGRVLTLLSIQHFMFHINDLSRNGYSFNTLKGRFTLQDGIISTENLVTQGVVADIHSKGSVNILKQWIDLKLAVIVNATSSLPVIATIASGFNPIVGVVTWIADKAVHKAMSKVTRYAYEVVGPWRDPKVIDLK